MTNMTVALPRPVSLGVRPVCLTLAVLVIFLGFAMRVRTLLLIAIGFAQMISPSAVLLPLRYNLLLTAHQMVSFEIPSNFKAVNLTVARLGFFSGFCPGRRLPQSSPDVTRR